MIIKNVDIRHYRKPAASVEFDVLAISVASEAHVGIDTSGASTEIVFYDVTPEDLRRIRDAADKGLRRMSREADAKIRAIQDARPHEYPEPTADEIDENRRTA
jgi:hypothetical protein